MEHFLSKHADAVIGTLSGFDRLVFRGTLRMLAHRSGMMSYLWAAQVLLNDFASHAQALTRQLKDASEALARRTGRPIRYLASSAVSKEDIARKRLSCRAMHSSCNSIPTSTSPSRDTATSAARPNTIWLWAPIAQTR